MNLQNIKQYKNYLSLTAICLVHSLSSVEISMAASRLLEVNVDQNFTATLSAGNLNLAVNDNLKKTGLGTLLLSGDQTGTDHIKGNIRVEAGILAADNSKSLGDCVAPLFYSDTTFQAAANSIVLSKALKLNNKTSNTSFNIDCYNHPITLSDIGANDENLSGRKAMTVNFKNTAPSAVPTAITLGGAYTQSKDDDIMVIQSNVNLVANSNDNLAQNIHMAHQSGIIATNSFTFAPSITFLNDANACSSTIDCHDHDITTIGELAAQTTHYPVTVMFSNTLDTHAPNFLSFSANYIQGTDDDKMVVDSKLVMLVNDAKHLAKNLQMNAQSKIRVTNSIVLPKTVVNIPI